MHPLLKIAIGGFIMHRIFQSNGTNKKAKRRIFISHSWNKASKDYNSFLRRLKQEKLEVYDHSIPINKAFDSSSKKELHDIFRKQMFYCSKIFVLAHNEIKKDSFVGSEIAIAQQLGKKIIAVKPIGQKGLPYFIKNKADVVISNRIDLLKKVLK